MVLDCKSIQKTKKVHHFVRLAAWISAYLASACLIQAYAQVSPLTASKEENTAAAFPKDDWIRFPARPMKALDNRESPAATNTNEQTPSKPQPRPEPNNASDWVQFPALPAPKAKASKPVEKPLDQTEQSGQEDKTPSTPTAATPQKPSPPEKAQTVEKTDGKDLPADSPVGDSSNQFKFKRFNFEGNTIYSSTTLSKMLTRKFSSIKDLNDLQQAAEAVANLYQDDGVLARVDLLPQDLTEGVVTMTITEGRFAGSRMETPESTKLPHDFLVKLVDTVQPKNTPVRLPQMDKATMLLKEIPGVQASVRLSTGTDEGETLALIQVQDKKPYDGQVSVDNTGSTYTGVYRFSSQYNHYGLLGRGDATNAQYLHSEGLDYLRLGYSEPMGYGGARWGLGTEFTKYTVINSTYDALDLHGPSTGVNAYVSQPLVRVRNFSSDLVLNGDHKKFTNHSSIATTRYQLDSLSASWQATHQDLWMGGGENNANVQVARGFVNNETAGASNQEGYYTKWRLNLNRKQKVDTQYMLLTSYQRQWANRTLDSSEKFNIGGSGAVRAYPSGEANGTQASLMTIELQRDLDWNNQAYKFSAFYDLGDHKKEKDSTSSTNAYKLQGLGLWLGASYPNKWGQSQWRVTWARRIGSNPGASNGNDSDGTYYLNRFWLSASQVF